MSGPRYLSFSGATLWRDCPRKWKFRYVDKLPSPPSSATAMGVFVHKVAELAHGDLNEVSWKRVARLTWDTDPSFGEQLAALALPDGGKAMRKESWPHLQAIMEWLEGKRLWVDPDGKPGVEWSARGEIGGVPFYGEIDRVNVDIMGDPCLVDWKSGKVPEFNPRYPDSQRKYDEKLDQLLLYARLLQTVTGCQPTEVVYVHTGTRSEGRPFKEIRLPVGKRGDQAVERLAKTWDEIQVGLRTQEFPHHTSPLCGWCPYVAQCPEGLAFVTKRYAQGKNVGPAESLVAA